MPALFLFLHELYIISSTVGLNTTINKCIIVQISQKLKIRFIILEVFLIK